MTRFLVRALGGATLLAACTIEQTPQVYIDHLVTPAGEIEVAREELTDRLLSTAPAIGRGDQPAVMAALVPSTNLVVFGAEPGQELRTGPDLVVALMGLRGDARIGMNDPLVSIGPNNDVAWFRTAFLLTAGDAQAREVPFSGVFIRQEGEWRLVQGHFSHPISPELLPPPVEKADTLAAGG